MRLRIVAFYTIAISTLLALSWPTYAAESTAVNDFWQQQANIVCQKLDATHHAYLQGDLQQAHVNALMAYFQAYDQKIEPAIRMTMGQARVFQTEQAFNKFNSSLVEHPTKEQINTAKQQSQALCQVVVADAKTLDAQHVKPKLYEVNP
jgi:hypothetical protein